MKQVAECTTVAELLEAPERWTKLAFARNVDGNGVPPRDSKAICWCLTGAMIKIAPACPPFDIEAAVLPMMHRVIAVTNCTALTAFNDDSDHATVLDAVRRAGI